MKEKLIITVIVITLVVITVLFMNGCFEKKKIIEQLKVGIEHRNDTTTHYREKGDSTLHAQNIALQEDLQTAKILHGNEMQEATRRLKIKDKQIENLNRVVANLQGSFTEKVDTSRRGDTTASVIHVDPFSTFKTATIGDKETVSYNIRVPIHLTQYWKRPHNFLGIKYGDPVNYIDGYSNNPNVTLDSLSNVRILTKKPGRWGAGPVVGFMTTGGRFTWSLGVGLSYSLIRW